MSSAGNKSPLALVGIVPGGCDPGTQKLTADRRPLKAAARVLALVGIVPGSCDPGTQKLTADCRPLKAAARVLALVGIVPGSCDPGTQKLTADRRPLKAAARVRFVGQAGSLRAGCHPAQALKAPIRRRGITLIEMTVVLAIVGLIVGVTLPAATSGLSSIRLKAAAGDVASFINSALNRAERHEQVMEIIVYPRERKLELDSSEPGLTRTLEMPQGVDIAGSAPLRILLMPGSAPPRVSIDLYNDRGAHRIVRLDPVTGVPLVAVPQEANP